MANFSPTTYHQNDLHVHPSYFKMIDYEPDICGLQQSDNSLCYPYLYYHNVTILL